MTIIMMITMMMMLCDDMLVVVLVGMTRTTIKDTKNVFFYLNKNQFYNYFLKMNVKLKSFKIVLKIVSILFQLNTF